MSDEQSMLELQIKVSFLEDAVSKLSDEYFAQQKELQQLSLTVEALLDKLARVDEGAPSTETAVDESPPHY